MSANTYKFTEIFQQKQNNKNKKSLATLESHVTLAN